MTEREALEKIVALAELAEAVSPPVSLIGHADVWVAVGKQAAKIARETLDGS